MPPPPAPSSPVGRSPRLSVALELGRALGGLALLPARLADYYFCRESLALELREDLERASEPPRAPADGLVLPRRVLHVFVSCAETSGEIHAAGLVDALRRRLADAGAPPPELIGLGGARLREAGVRTLDDPVARATMGLSGALSGLPYYLGLLARSARALHGTDLALLVDSPALHVPLGRIARRAGARSVHFVTPQYWGWAPWRARGYRRAVDRALTILPFERAWFARRGVEAVHVGHPLLDALPSDVPGPDDPRRNAIALLPGSRRGVIDRNLPWMLTALRAVRDDLGPVEVVLPHGDPELEPLLRDHVRAARAEGWVRLELGSLHASLSRARAALSVSGTVLIDLLHQRVPSVVLYGLRGAGSLWLYRQLVVAPWFASPNLLAGRPVLPEHAFAGEGPLDAVGTALRHCYNDGPWRRRCLEGLELAARRLGPSGACDRAAAAALELLPADPP